MARAPLPPRVDTPGPVRQHSEGVYRYEMLADLSVLVLKSGDPAYSITAEGQCECPGFLHRGRCKHADRAAQMVNEHLSKAWSK